MYVPNASVVEVLRVGQPDYISVGELDAEGHRSLDQGIALPGGDGLDLRLIVVLLSRTLGFLEGPVEDLDSGDRILGDLVGPQMATLDVVALMPQNLMRTGERKAELGGQRLVNVPLDQHKIPGHEDVLSGFGSRRPALGNDLQVCLTGELE